MFEGSDACVWRQGSTGNNQSLLNRSVMICLVFPSPYLPFWPFTRAFQKLEPHASLFYFETLRKILQQDCCKALRFDVTPVPQGLLNVGLGYHHGFCEENEVLNSGRNWSDRMHHIRFLGVALYSRQDAKRWSSVASIYVSIFGRLLRKDDQWKIVHETNIVRKLSALFSSHNWLLH